jgi:hypothetical protein
MANATMIKVGGTKKQKPGNHNHEAYWGHYEGQLASVCNLCRDGDHRGDGVM